MSAKKKRNSRANRKLQKTRAATRAPRKRITPAETAALLRSWSEIIAQTSGAGATPSFPPVVQSVKVTKGLAVLVDLLSNTVAEASVRGLASLKRTTDRDSISAQEEAAAKVRRRELGAVRAFEFEIWPAIAKIDLDRDLETEFVRVMAAHRDPSVVLTFGEWSQRGRRATERDQTPLYQLVTAARIGATAVFRNTIPAHDLGRYVLELLEGRIRTHLDELERAGGLLHVIRQYANEMLAMYVKDARVRERRATVPIIGDVLDVSGNVTRHTIRPQRVPIRVDRIYVPPGTGPWLIHAIYVDDDTDNLLHAPIPADVFASDNADVALAIPIVRSRFEIDVSYVGESPTGRVFRAVLFVTEFVH